MKILKQSKDVNIISKCTYKDRNATYVEITYRVKFSFPARMPEHQASAYTTVASSAIMNYAQSQVNKEQQLFSDN